MQLTFQLFVLTILVVTTIAAPNAARPTLLSDEGILRDSGGTRNWSYTEPDLWPQEYCSGQRQSPIDIDPFSTIQTEYPSFDFRNYKRTFPVNITLDGITENLVPTVKIEPSTPLPDKLVPYITGGGLNGRYIFAQFHFHWGSAKDNGSEHTVSSKAYAAEMHFVHYKSDYGSLAEALQHEDGVAALSVLAQEKKYIPDMDISNPFNYLLNQLFDDESEEEELRHLPRVVQTITPPLQSFLPLDVEEFFRYSGSLTTPNCQEVVTWTVFRRPVIFSTRQLESLRSLQLGSDGLPLVLNSRPTQPLNDRVVMYRSNPWV